MGLTFLTFIPGSPVHTCPFCKTPIGFGCAYTSDERIYPLNAFNIRPAGIITTPHAHWERQVCAQCKALVAHRCLYERDYVHLEGLYFLTTSTILAGDDETVTTWTVGNDGVAVIEIN